MKEEYYIVAFDIIDKTFGTQKMEGWFTHWEDKDKHCFVTDWDEALKFTTIDLAIKQFSLYRKKIDNYLENDNLIIKNIRILSVIDKPIFKEVYALY